MQSKSMLPEMSNEVSNFPREQEDRTREKARGHLVKESTVLQEKVRYSRKDIQGRKGICVFGKNGNIDRKRRMKFQATEIK